MMFDVRKCDDEVESEYKCFDNISIKRFTIYKEYLNMVSNHLSLLFEYL